MIIIRVTIMIYLLYAAEDVKDPNIWLYNAVY